MLKLDGAELLIRGNACVRKWKSQLVFICKQIALEKRFTYCAAIIMFFLLPLNVSINMGMHDGVISGCNMSGSDFFDPLHMISHFSG